MNVRMAKVEDAKDLLNIYEYYVTNPPITFEYDVPTIEEFKNRIETTLKRYPYIVAEENGKIYGYAYAGAFKCRRAYDWSVETSIYVQYENSSKGVGTLLYNELERLLKMQNIINVNACITYPNEKSQEFHKKFGYKFNTWHDIIWMEKFIEKHHIPPKDVILFSQLNLK